MTTNIPNIICIFCLEAQSPPSQDIISEIHSLPNLSLENITIQIYSFELSIMSFSFPAFLSSTVLNLTHCSTNLKTTFTPSSRRPRHQHACNPSTHRASTYQTRMSLAESVWDINTVPKVESASGKKVAIVGAGLAGLITGMELSDSGFQVNIYDTRPFVGGKVGSWTDSEGNHIEMGLHVFFGCYYNLFDIMIKIGSFKHLLLKQHTHQFINKGGNIASLDFRMGGIGAPFNGLKAFATTQQLGVIDKIKNAYALGRSVIVKGLINFDGAMKDIRNLDDISFSDWFISKGGSRGSIDRLWNPIAYALGFIDCDNMSARCMLTIFQLFAVKSEASVLRMLEGSPDKYLTGPIVKYIEDNNGKIHLRRRIRNIDWSLNSKNEIIIDSLQVANGSNTEKVVADYYVAACDVQGMKRLIPNEWRQKYTEFDKIFSLTSVPVITVQLRYDGWVTELSGNGSLDNLLYSADTDFSCFADLAITSPTDYYKEGLGSLMQCVLTPGDPYMKKSDEFIVQSVKEQLESLFPSAKGLNVVWTSVVKLGESLYKETPGMDRFRPNQKTSIDNLILSGSYTFQDYIDSMEGACKSGRLAAAVVLENVKNRETANE